MPLCTGVADPVKIKRPFCGFWSTSCRTASQRLELPAIRRATGALVPATPKRGQVRQVCGFGNSRRDSPEETCFVRDAKMSMSSRTISGLPRKSPQRSSENHLFCYRSAEACNLHRLWASFCLPKKTTLHPHIFICMSFLDCT